MQMVVYAALETPHVYWEYWSACIVSTALQTQERNSRNKACKNSKKHTYLYWLYYDVIKNMTTKRALYLRLVASTPPPYSGLLSFRRLRNLFDMPLLLQYLGQRLPVTNFTFMWPCIVTNFFVIKPTRCNNFTNLFCHETLHVSDSSSVHHQEFIHCTLNNGICHTGL